VSVSSRPSPHVLEALLERLTYVNEETGYTIARVATHLGSGLIKDIGPVFAERTVEHLGPDRSSRTNRAGWWKCRGWDRNGFDHQRS
jgi:exodeoxyribonuclease V alpha subunit